MTAISQCDHQSYHNQLPTRTKGDQKGRMTNDDSRLAIALHKSLVTWSGC
ncbi:MAG: hypothetical protein AB1589_03335 [Cyanobacteriota bacterium]